ncbi:hypothetical protein [Sinorhizobium meliloti]|uniref:hypothetical protein n=1 Tax=Rhizobium meliloti TaxID=382 RepID=UPI001AEC846B|nr:hypothetical protein [Sinorhizobium meliloti]
MLAVKAFNEAIDADGYETSYDIIANAIKAALGQTALRKDNGDELLGAHPSRFGNPDLAHEGDEPGVAVQLNGEVRGTDHRVSPLSREENTPPDDLPLSKVAASENHTVGRWIPVEQADKSVDRVIDLPDLGMRITNSENYWMRDDEGRTFHATWADDGKRAYWWDFDSESPVDPVEFMPHPLDPRWAALASEGSDNG